MSEHVFPQPDLEAIRERDADWLSRGITTRNHMVAVWNDHCALLAEVDRLRAEIEGARILIIDSATETNRLRRLDKLAREWLRACDQDARPCLCCDEGYSGADCTCTRPQEQPACREAYRAAVEKDGNER